MAEKKTFRQVALVANSKSLLSIEQSVNYKLMALQLKDPSCVIHDISCGAYIAPVAGVDQKKQETTGNTPVNLLWLASIDYETSMPVTAYKDSRRNERAEQPANDKVFVVEHKD